MRVVRGPMRYLILALALGAAGCISEQPLSRPGSGRDYRIACASALGWDGCHREANDLCPAGWQTARQGVDGDRNLLTITCPSAAPQR